MSLVSFIIPVFKAEEFLPCCLESIQNQSVKNIEIICINDNSPDQSKNIINAYACKDQRIKLIDLEENMGQGYARNQGIKVAHGKYIRMVDPDDFLPYNSTEKLVKNAESSGCNIVKGTLYHCDRGGRRVRPSRHFSKSIPITGAVHKEKKFWYFDQHTTYLYSAELIRKSDARYSEKMRYGEDISFFLDLFPFLEKMTLIPETVYYYRHHPESTMRGNKNKEYYLNLFSLYELEYMKLGTRGFREIVDYFILYHLRGILPYTVLAELVENLDQQESLATLSVLKNIFTTYGVQELCFTDKYAWQKEYKLPLISRQLIILFSGNYMEEAYETIKITTEQAREKQQLQKQIAQTKDKLHALHNSTSWRLTAPIRWLKARKRN